MDGILGKLSVFSGTSDKLGVHIHLCKTLLRFHIVIGRDWDF